MSPAGEVGCEETLRPSRVGVSDKWRGRKPVARARVAGGSRFFWGEMSQDFPNQLLLVFDDEPTNGTWLFGLVSSIEEVSTLAGLELRELTIKTAPGDTEGDTTLPAFIDEYNRPSPASGFITSVTVISYKTAPTESGIGGSDVLWRQVNWGEPTEVAFVEDLQFRYFMGTTVTGVRAFQPTGQFAEFSLCLSDAAG